MCTQTSQLLLVVSKLYGIYCQELCSMLGTWFLPKSAGSFNRFFYCVILSASIGCIIETKTAIFYSSCSLAS